MKVEATYQNIRDCKDQCNRLVSILYKNRSFDTVGVLSSAAHCNKILLQCVQKCNEKKDGALFVPDFIWKLDVIFQDMHKCLRHMSKNFEKLFVGSGKVTKLISKMRVTRQIELGHRDLFQYIDIIEKQLEKSTLETLLGSSEENNKKPDLVELISDPAFKELWLSAFGSEGIGNTKELLKSCENLMKFRVKEIKKIRYILDHQDTGNVSVYTFAQFVRLFGPAAATKDNLDYICSPLWFHGYASSSEAEKLLKGCPPGTYIIRFSQTRPGCIVFSSVALKTNSAERKSSKARQFTHIVVEPVNYSEFRVKEFVDLKEVCKTFPTLQSIHSHYGNRLLTPLTPSVAQEIGFHRSLSEDEATELLFRQPSGTYLFRFSVDDDKPTTLIVSYVAELQIVKHTVIQSLASGFTLVGDCHTYITLGDLIKETKFVDLQHPLTCTNLQLARRISVIFSPAVKRRPNLRQTGKSQPSICRSIVNRAVISVKSKDEIEQLEELFETSEHFLKFLALKESHTQVLECDNEICNASLGSTTPSIVVTADSESDDEYDESEDSDVNEFEEENSFFEACLAGSYGQCTLENPSERRKTTSLIADTTFAKSLSFTTLSLPFQLNSVFNYQDEEDTFSHHDASKLVSSLFSS